MPGRPVLDPEELDVAEEVEEPSLVMHVEAFEGESGEVGEAIAAWLEEHRERLVMAPEGIPVANVSTSPPNPEGGIVVVVILPLREVVE